MTTRPRVGIMFWDGFFSVAPALIAAVDLLAESGYDVTVLLHAPLADAKYAPPPPFSDAVHIYETKTVLHWYSANRQSLPGQAHVLFFFAGLLQYIIFCLINLGFRRYRVFLPVEPNALIAASVAGLLKRTPVIYWSFEMRLIMRSNHRDAIRSVLRAAEQRLGKRAQNFIVQDKYRGAIFTELYGIPPEKFLYVPNGQRGTAKAAKGTSIHSYFHRQFALPASERIALHAGMISPVGLSLEAAQAARNWPAGITLVLHERRSLDQESLYLKQIADAGGDRVRLSLDPVAIDQLDEVVSSGDVGLVLYAGNFGNRALPMTWASSKLAEYLRCGLPIITVELEGMRNLLARYDCGICIDNVSEIGAALERIFADYDRYSANALRCFREEYEFDSHFAAVMKVIEADGR